MARKSRKNIDAPMIDTAPVQSVCRAAGYVRLSSDDRRKRGDSIETQKCIIENWIAACPDIELHDFYIDTGATGTNFDRPAFQKMLADAERGVVSAIVVKDLSRFGRNAIDSGYYIERYLPSINIRLIAVNDGFDSAHARPGDGILIPLKNTINEAYSLDISRKCRAVQRQNIREGKFVGRLAPYGYLKATDDCHRLVIDEAAAPVVRQMFDWAAQGIIAREIARRLNTADVPSPSQYKRDQGFKVNHTLSACWQQRTVDIILTDRVYVGDLLQGKTKKVNHVQVNVSPDEWILVENTHAPIISRELFETVQRVRARISLEDQEKRSAPAPYSLNFFKGKIFCAQCGHAMHRNRQNSDGAYWFRCESKWKYAESACVQVSVKESDLLETILVTAEKHFETLCGDGLTFWLNRQIISTKQVSSNAELSSIRQQLSRNGMYLKSLYENLVSGIISKDDFQRMKLNYEEKIRALQSRAEALELERQNFERQNTQRFDLFQSLRGLRVKPDLTAAVIDALIEKILVYPDKSVEIVFKFQDEFREVARVG